MFRVPRALRCGLASLLCLQKLLSTLCAASGTSANVKEARSALKQAIVSLAVGFARQTRQANVA